MTASNGEALPRAAVVASNLVPLVGAALLDWSPAALVVLFVFEAWVILLFAFLKVPFARRRQEPVVEADHGGLLGGLQAKRGSISLPGLPPIYVRNLPGLPALLVLGGLEAMTGFIVIGLAEPTVTARTAEVILLGAVGMLVSRGAEFYADYLRGGRYREISAGRIAMGPFTNLVGLGVLIPVVAALRALTGTSTALTAAALTVVVTGKTAFDLYVFWRDHVEGRDPLLAGQFATRETEVDPEPVSVPAGDPEARLRPRRLAVALDGLARGGRYLLIGGDGGLPLLLLAGAALAAITRAPVVVAGVLGLAAGFVFLRATVFAVRYGLLEYRLYPDRLVVHDRWLDAPQASIRYDAVSDATTSDPGSVVDAVTVELDAPEWADGAAVTLSSLDGETARRVLERI